MNHAHKHTVKHKVLILMVEDSEYNHALYRDVFEQAGFEVVIVSNADGFFPEKVSEIRPDIISMDLMLGADGVGEDRDGFGAIETLKSDLRTSDIPIIVLTNFFEEGKVQRAKELGAVDFLNTAAFAIQRIPDYFKNYLKDPKHYKAAHPEFRTTV